MIHRNNLAFLLLGPEKVMEKAADGLKGDECKRHQASDRMVAVELYNCMLALPRCF